MLIFFNWDRSIIIFSPCLKNLSVSIFVAPEPIKAIGFDKWVTGLASPYSSSCYSCLSSKTVANDDDDIDDIDVIDVIDADRMVFLVQKNFEIDTLVKIAIDQKADADWSHALVKLVSFVLVL